MSTTPILNQRRVRALSDTLQHLRAQRPTTALSQRLLEIVVLDDVDGDFAGRHRTPGARLRCDPELLQPSHDFGGRGPGPGDEHEERRPWTVGVCHERDLKRSHAAAQATSKRVGAR
ncbi:MAG TPA: hypothetical protein VI197_04440 [Polyangiaceae bacterium]